MQSKKIAVTGGIASGKSTLCHMLEEEGFSVYSCDEISHALWEETWYREALSHLFPTCSIEGEADPILVAKEVFSDAEKRRKLEEFSHPIIIKRLFSKMKDEVCFAEVPLLYEGGFDTMFDGVIYVRRSASSRLKSAAVRDHMAEEEIARRMEAQKKSVPEGEDVFIADNDGTEEDLRERVKEALRFFRISR